MYLSIENPFCKVMHPLPSKNPPYAQVNKNFSSLPTTPEVASATFTQENVERPMTKVEILGASQRAWQPCGKLVVSQWTHCGRLGLRLMKKVTSFLDCQPQEISQYRHH